MTMRLTRFPRRSLSSKIFRRSISDVPPLPQFAGINYIPELLSPLAFEMSWRHFQSYTLDNLRRLVAGSGVSDRSPKDIAIYYARDPAHAATFNFASMAHNNHFFFESLSRDSTTPDSMPPKLKEQLIRSFGSIETFKLEMLKTAKAMFGPGFVWLVKDFSNNFAILATYLAGSPYPQANYRLQPFEVKSEVNENIPKDLSHELQRKMTGPATNQVGRDAPEERTSRIPPGAPTALTPILCINLWQQLYLPDYGIRPEILGGKPRYVENWWNKIDWQVVGYRALGDRKLSYTK